jgi:hypothetical protein
MALVGLSFGHYEPLHFTKYYVSTTEFNCGFEPPGRRGCD